MTRPVLIDIETRSPVDLRQEGGLRYAAHPATELLTVAWIDPEDDGRHLWLPSVRDPEALPAGFLSTHLLPGTHVHVGSDPPDNLRQLAAVHPFCAHNAWSFDEPVWQRCAPADVQPREWLDTVPHARTAALPGQLDKIGEELRRKGKDKLGKSKMLKFSRSQERFPGVGDLIIIGAYNQDDVELLRVLWDHLQERPVPEFEKKVIWADRRVNSRGVRLDVDLAGAVVALADAAVLRAVDKVRDLTGGALSTLEDLRGKKLKDWVARQGGRLGRSIARPVIEQLLAEWKPDQEDTWTVNLDGDDGDDPEECYLPPVVAEVLRTRFACMRITGAKTRVALNRVKDGRLHWLLAYGAAHTLRWGGRALQPHNFPRPKETVPVWDGCCLAEDPYPGEGLMRLYERTGRFDPDAVTEILCAYGAKVRERYRKDGLDPPPVATLDDAASALTRMILVGDEGENVCGPDYNAVEFRGAGWLAQEDKILDYFARGVDPYGEMAYAIYGRRPASKKDPIRQVAKVVDLGSIYQMSHNALYAYGLSQGLDWDALPVTPAQCTAAFRREFQKLAGRPTGRYVDDGRIELTEGGLWKDMDRAALRAVKYGESQTPNGRARFTYVGGDLLMWLPSGRPIRYRNARVEKVRTPWGALKDQVVFRSPRGWDGRLHGGVLTENFVQAMCRDLTALTVVRCEEAGLKVILHVHDEVVCSVRNEAEAHLMTKIMSEPPDWAPDFPLLAEAEIAPRYAKSAPKFWPTFNYENGVRK